MSRQLSHVESGSFGELQIKRAMSQLEVARLRAYPHPPRMFGFSRDGRLFVSVDEHDTVMLWDIRSIPMFEDVSTEPEWTEPEQEKRDAKSPNGQLRAKVREETEGCVGDYTGDCIRWTKLTLVDTDSNLEIKTLTKRGPAVPLDFVFALEFRADGKLKLTQGPKTQIWHVDPKYLTERACSIANRSLSNAELDQHLGWRRWIHSAGNGCKSGT